MKRRVGDKLTAKSICLEPAEWATLAAMAKAQGVTVSRLIGSLLKPWLP